MARGRLLRRPRMVLLLASMPSNALDMKSSAPLTGWAAAPTRPWPSPFTKPAADTLLSDTFVSGGPKPKASHTGKITQQLPSRRCSHHGLQSATLASEKDAGVRMTNLLYNVYEPQL